MKNSDLIRDFSIRNKCSLSEAKHQIELLQQETKETNQGINSTIENNGYVRFPDDLNIFSYGLNDELNNKYLCYTPNIKKILQMDKKDVAVVSGFGATNSPTIGTLSMMLKIIDFQRKTKLYTYIIINDLGSINARKIDPLYVLKLTQHFKDFLIKLGFDTTNGEIRTHNDLDHARTFSLISSNIKLSDFNTNSEATDDTYNRLKLRGNDFSAMVDHVYTATDVLLPILRYKKKGIIIPCGLEEFYHANIGGIAYNRMINSKFYKSFVPDGVEIGAVYSKLIDGFFPYFKQSKSIKDASLYLDASKKSIKSKIMNCYECNEYVILQMIEQGTTWSNDEIRQAQFAFKKRKSNPRQWRKIKTKFYDYFLKIKDIWDSYQDDLQNSLFDLLY